MPRPYDQACPIARTLDLIGDRWTMLIVRDLFLGKTRFNQFLESSSGLPPKLLSDRLKKLVDNGLIERSVYSQHPLRAEYHLSERGRTLLPVIEEISRWGFDNCFDGEAALRDEVRGRVERAGLSLAPRG
ncbi:MAG: helix-turn-helix domain-containing protein [Dehalococcoidia bacterium]